MSLKKFLVPVAALISSLGVANASTHSVAPVSESGKSDAKEGASVKSASSKQLSSPLFSYTRGDEIHSLTVKPNEVGTILAYHYSHSSHASHASHASHYSSR